MENISDYLNDKLSEQDSEALTQKLVRAKLDQDKRQKWKNTLEEQYQVKRTSSPKKNKRRISFLRWRNIAAIFLIVSMAVVFYLLQQTPVETQASVATMAMNELIDDKYFDKTKDNRGLNLNAEILEEEARKAYNENRYEDARIGFEQVIAKSPDHSSSHLFLALSLLHLKDYPRAINELQSLRSQSPHLLQDETDWFIALAFILNKQPELAKKELKNIVKTKSWKTAKAAKFLQKME